MKEKYSTWIGKRPKKDPSVQYFGENVPHGFRHDRRNVRHPLRMVQHRRKIVRNRRELSNIFDLMSIILPFSFNMEKNSSNMKEKMFIISEKTSIIARKMSIIAPSVRHPRRSVQNRGKFSSLRGRNGTVPAAFSWPDFRMFRLPPHGIGSPCRTGLRPQTIFPNLGTGIAKISLPVRCMIFSKAGRIRHEGEWKMQKRFAELTGLSRKAHEDAGSL